MNLQWVANYFFATGLVIGLFGCLLNILKLISKPALCGWCVVGMVVAGAAMIGSNNTVAAVGGVFAVVTLLHIPSEEKRLEEQREHDARRQWRGYRNV